MFGEGVFTEGGVLNVNPPVALITDESTYSLALITDESCLIIGVDNQ